MTGKDLRIVFMGTPDFAVEPLRRLVEGGYNIVGVVTVPDKPAGRGLKLQQSAVKRYAEEKGLNILQPVKLKDEQFVGAFANLNADLAIVIAFRMLPEVVWSQPRLGTFNLHASLLPEYRGAAPINWAVINGDTVSGVTTFMLNSEIDKGAILGQVEVEIEDGDTAGTLHDKLMYVGTELVIETVEKIASGEAKPLEQPQSDKTFRSAPKIFKEDCLVRWDRTTEEIYNHIRGLSPYPAAWSYLFPVSQPACVVKQENERGEVVSGQCAASKSTSTSNYSAELLTVKLFSASKELTAHGLRIGEVATDGKSSLKIATRDGFIIVEELQLAGKKRMRTEEFLRGFDISRYNFYN